MSYTAIVLFGLPYMGSPFRQTPFNPPSCQFSLDFPIFLDDPHDNMSSSSCFTDIHVRDFVHEVRHDPSRPGYDSALQLHSDVNIPPVQGEELSDDVDVKSVPTLVRFFVTNGQADLFLCLRERSILCRW